MNHQLFEYNEAPVRKLPEPPEWPKDLPKPGFYHGVPFDEYLSWPAVSQSVLKIGIGVSWLHARAILDGKISNKETQSLIFGKAMHAYLFDRKSFEIDFQIAKSCSAKITSGRNSGKECGKRGSFKAESGEWYCGIHARGRDAVRVTSSITVSDYKSIVSLADQVRSSDAYAIMRARGGAEVSIICDFDGYPFKARLDSYAEPQVHPTTGKLMSPIILDGKKVSAQRITEHDLQRSIREYGYDFQAAAYCRVVRTITQKQPAFYWAFFEDSYPNEIVVRQAAREYLQIGDAKFNRAWEDYKLCMQHDYWPGCDSVVTSPLAPPDWEIRKYLGE
jgi:PDDEXK-like domain of unknown function (DUF3799)